ncbi:hypothetical protein GQ607_014371 [Colletotrichum asianum]|uniref:FHA domain-containing protein n=1 Tax=Colletotrichum asianum TaxID=702518 RepID=A0A8H3W583_9PEZI|nr:hypothetical protein GQ607_014371 [Colletotrichum asianum]
MAAPSLNPWKVADALEDQYVIRVRISDPLIFNATSKETPQGWLCRIHEFESCDNSEESSSTPGPEAGPTGGVLLFSGPKNLHEKLRANIPDGFLAGRQKTLNDIVFGPKFGQVSRHHFAVGIYKDQWVVFNMSRNGTWVNGDYLQGENSLLALNPEMESEIRLGNPPFSLFIRCQRPNIARLRDLWPNRDTTLSEVDNTSQGTTVATTNDLGEGSSLLRIYYLEDHKIPSRTGVKKILALNARTCDLHVAKAYPIADRDRLQERIELLQSLPQTHSGPFLQDHALILAEDAVYLLSPYLETIHTLRDVTDFGKENSQTTRERHAAARQLLRSLLKVVSLLHTRYMVSHGDLSLRTVFSGSLYDCEQLYVAGFSEAASLTPTRAKADCLAIFNMVGDFLGEDPHQGWLAIDFLDSLWDQSRLLRGGRTWSYSVTQVCNLLDLTYDADDARWKRITVSKDVMIRYQREGRILRYQADDIQDFAALAAMRSTIAEPASAQRNMQTAMSVLRRFIKEKGVRDHLSQDEFDAFSLHMTRHHNLSIFLQPSLRRDHYSERSTSLFFAATINFKIPYQTQFGWINLSSLRLLGSLDLTTSIRGLLEDCFEVRGYCGGVYVTVDDHLARAAELLRVRYSDDELTNHGNKELERYTWAKGWFILCPHESSDMVPVERTNELVRGKEPLGKFLKSHMPYNPLDAFVAQDPRVLLAPHMMTSSTYDGTLESSDSGASSLPAWGRPDKVSNHVEMTSQWLDTTEHISRRRVHRADMIRTKFVRNT